MIKGNPKEGIIDPIPATPLVVFYGPKSNLGRNRQKSGQYVTIASCIKPKQVKGKVPLMVSHRGALATPEMTKRLSPTGGVSRASSMFTVIRIPK